jgi:hypothetical protein
MPQPECLFQVCLYLCEEQVFSQSPHQCVPWRLSLLKQTHSVPFLFINLSALTQLSYPCSVIRYCS